MAYTVVANHIPINARIIGANEHESHYVFDLLFNNTTEIQPEVHSTDTHGTNEVNFALLHLFGYQFAPRYRDFYDKVRTTLYGFKHPRQYTTGVLRPVRKINTPPHHRGLGQDPTDPGVARPENHDPEYYRGQTQCLCPQEQNPPRAVGV